MSWPLHPLASGIPLSEYATCGTVARILGRHARFVNRGNMARPVQLPYLRVSTPTPTWLVVKGVR